MKMVTAGAIDFDKDQLLTVNKSLVKSGIVSVIVVCVVDCGFAIRQSVPDWMDEFRYLVMSALFAAISTKGYNISVWWSHIGHTRVVHTCFSLCGGSV